MSENKVIRFGSETWKKGTRGLVHASATDKARIENMRLWDNETLGPRPLWLATDVTLPTKFSSSAKIWPARYNLGFANGPNAEGYMAVEGADWEFFEYGTSTRFAAFTGSLTFGGGGNSSLSQISDTEWLLDEYYIDLAGISGMPNQLSVTDAGAAIDTLWGGGDNIQCDGSVIHQGRAFYFGPMFSGTTYSATNRIYFSDAYGYATFASTQQTFDVDGTVKGMASVGANLFIWTDSGEWYMLQGRGDPNQGTLSSLGKGRIPGLTRFVAKLDRSALFLSSDTQSVVSISEGGQIDDKSLGFLGADDQAVPYDEAAPPLMANSSIANSVLQPFYVDTARHNLNGAWTDEDWGLTTYSNFQIGTDEIKSREMLAIYVPGGSAAWEIHYRPITNDEPDFSNAGDFSEYAETEDCELDLPRLMDPNRNVRIRRVLIDARTWSANASYWPSAALTVTVDDGKSNSTALVLGPESQPLSGVDEAANTPIRITATPSLVLPYTHFSDVKLSGMKGIAIEAVTVELEISQGPVQ